MNIDELAQQDLMIRIYGLPMEGLTLKLDKASPLAGYTPVLVKGWGWKEICVATRERRVLLLSGAGEKPEGCGWLAPVKMWVVDRASRTMALDVRAGTVEQLIEAVARIEPASSTPQAEHNAAESPIAVDDETARRFEKFLSDESLLKSTAWVAHQANNEL